MSPTESLAYEGVEVMYRKNKYVLEVLSVRKTLSSSPSFVQLSFGTLFIHDSCSQLN